jgi:hypothetical protein
MMAAVFGVFDIGFKRLDNQKTAKTSAAASP